MVCHSVPVWERKMLLQGTTCAIPHTQATSPDEHRGTVRAHEGRFALFCFRAPREDVTLSSTTSSQRVT